MNMMRVVVAVLLCVGVAGPALASHITATYCPSAFDTKLSTLRALATLANQNYQEWRTETIESVQGVTGETNQLQVDQTIVPDEALRLMDVRTVDNGCVEGRWSIVAQNNR